MPRLVSIFTIRTHVLSMRYGLTSILLLVLFLYAVLAQAQHHKFATDDTITTTTLSLEGDTSLGEGNWRHEDNGISYEAEFPGLDRGIIGRATTSNSLENNVPHNLNLVQNTTIYYTISNATIQAAQKLKITKDEEQVDLHNDAQSELGDDEDYGSQENGKLEEHLSRRQTTTSSNVWISVNTCLQPNFTSSTVVANPPQLTLYVSTSTSNQYPGPGSVDSQTTTAVLNEGYAVVEVQAIGDVYVSISAPKVDVFGTSVWNYEIAASVDKPYHFFNNTGPSLKLLDSDTQAGLLVTDGLSGLNETLPHSWTMTPVLSMFATSINDYAMVGMRHSYCAVSNGAQISAVTTGPSSAGVQFGVTTTQPGPLPEEQFYIPGLDANSTYYGYLAISGNSTNVGANVAGGGGTVFPFMNFTTKLNSNCGLIFNLTFCSTIAYAVPANPFRYPNLTELAQAYDASAEAYLQNFTYSLQQIPCHTTPAAQYSLVKTCDDCRNAYKTWLCAVTIPRCFDFNNPPGANPADYAYLQPRNVAQQPIPGSGIPIQTNQTQINRLATNASRNMGLIVEKIQPGPYREVLPCEDLCYDLIRSCPAALGFACPLKGKGLEQSYGFKGVSLASGGGNMCSEPGGVYYASGAVRVVEQRGRWCMMVVFGMMILVL